MFTIFSLSQAEARFETLISGSVVKCSTTELPLLAQNSVLFEKDYFQFDVFLKYFLLRLKLLNLSSICQYFKTFPVVVDQHIFIQSWQLEPQEIKIF
jgi:hypothetical protein